MSAAATPLHTRSGPRTGWVLVRGDGLVTAVDPDFTSLVGAPNQAALVGRPWPSLVTPRSADRLREAEHAVAAGQPWSGALELRFGDRSVELQFEVLGAALPEDVVLMRAVEIAGGATGQAAPAVDAGESAELRALVAAMEAVENLGDAAAAARSVLQALHPRLPFDWAVVLLLSSEGAEVLCTYPSPMAGIESGSVWSSLDSAERYVLTSGEPSLTGELAVSAEDSSPLARLPGLGMRSALRLPLYGGERVLACVLLYCHEPNAFTAIDGVRLDRFVGPLGRRLRECPTAAGPAPDGPAAVDMPALTAPEAGEPPSPPAEPESAAPAVRGTGAVSSEDQSERLAAMADWFTDCCVLESDSWTATASLRSSYTTYVGDDGPEIMSNREFAKQLRTRGLAAARQGTPRMRGWLGIRLKRRSDFRPQENS